MDEFDKIRELTEDLSHRREPSFTGFYQTKPLVGSEQSEETPKVSVEQESSNTLPSEQEVEGISSFEPVDSQEQPEIINEPAPVTEPVVQKTEPEIKIYDFSKPIDEEISFIPLENEQPIDEKSFQSLKLHLILISVLIVVLGLSLTGFFIFQASEAEPDEIETILASQDVVKELPENAGGIVIPDQDKLVYNRIRSDNVTTKVESLFPEPEKPVVPQILAIEQNTPEPTFVNVQEMKTINPLEEANKAVKADESKKEEIQVVQVETPVVKQEEVLKPKKEEIELTPLNAPEVKKVETPSKKEIWRVQLFASNSKPAVEKAWKVMKTKHVKLLSNMSYLIKKVEIPRKGDFYRLQVGQFPTREMAEGMCSKLKAQKQDCIPVK